MPKATIIIEIEMLRVKSKQFMRVVELLKPLTGRLETIDAKSLKEINRQGHSEISNE